MENMPNVSTANSELSADMQAPAEPVRNEDVEMAEEASESSHSSHSSPMISVPLSSENDSPEERPTKSSDVEIEEVFEIDNPTEPSTASEPVVTEHEEVPEASSEKKSDMVTEIPTVCTCS